MQHMAPELRRQLKPFAEAVAFHRKRAAVSADEFYEMRDAARARAFSVSGGLRQSAIVATHKLLDDAIARGITKSEFADEFGKLLDANGGIVFDRNRLDLIYQNNYAAAYSAGRFEQMNDPAVLKERPYRQYPKGPNDSKTSTICKPLQGLIWRAGDPIEKHIWPANHHGERHLNVLTLTEEQAKAEGEIYVSPKSGREYPFVDGREILPDPGFDYAPGLLNSDVKSLTGAAAKLGETLPSKTAASYELASIADSIDALPAASRVLKTGGGFKKVLGIEGETTLRPDYAGDGVVLGSAPIGAMPEAVRVRAAQMAATLDDPFEVWLVPVDRDGETTYIKRYFGAFRRGRAAEVLVLDRSPEGLLFRGELAEDAEARREGLLVHTKSTRSGE